MKRFQDGQQVICTHPTGMWLGILPGPFYGELVTISKYSSIHPGSIELVEYPHSRLGNDLPECFVQMWFEPITDVNALVESLSEDTEPAVK